LVYCRYVVIEYPRQGSVYCNVTRAKIAIALVYVVTCIICIPNFVSITVQPLPKDRLTTDSCVLDVKPGEGS